MGKLVVDITDELEKLQLFEGLIDTLLDRITGLCREEVEPGNIYDS